MDTHGIPVTSIRKHPRGGLNLWLAPSDPDPNIVYGAQGGIDLFTPDTEQTTPANGMGTTYLDGILGDPSASQRAVLEVDNKARRTNARRRISQEALTQGIEYAPEGTLYITE